MSQVTFIAPTYNEKYDIYMFCGSMLCQSNYNWKAIIYSNGENSHVREIVHKFQDERLIYHESEHNTGFWGCYNRINALENIVNTELIVQTSIQDYFLPNTVDLILNHREYDFIYWNSLHHYFGHSLLDAGLHIGGIDWGNFAIKTSIARQVGINHPEAYDADGRFVMDCVNSGLIENRVKLDKILTIHN